MMTFNKPNYHVITTRASQEHFDTSHRAEGQDLEPPVNLFDRWIRRSLDESSQNADELSPSQDMNSSSTLTIRNHRRSTVSGDREAYRRIFSTPRHRKRSSSFRIVQEWEGYVVEISTTHFKSQLIDLTQGAAVEDEEADIPLEEISPIDRRRIEVGSVFRWIVGYERTVSGSRRHVSHIVFRDLPRYTRRDVEAGRRWADKIFEWLGQ